MASWLPGGSGNAGRIPGGIGRPKWPPLSTLGVTVRYLIAVPFLAVGAALLTVGALIAGTASPPRKAMGRAQRDPKTGQYRC